MANNPKKIVDPTEAALSAIQEALKIRDDEARPETGMIALPIHSTAMAPRLERHAGRAGRHPAP